jgi:hypothetical protein
MDVMLKDMPWAPNLRSYARICLEGLRKGTNNLRIFSLWAEIRTRDRLNTITISGCDYRRGMD